MLSPATANMDPQLAPARRQAALRRAPITLVVMPKECQSIPITAPND